MNVLLVTDEMLLGGVSRHVVDLANGLKCKGVNIFVASTDGPARKILSPSIPFYDISVLKEGSYSKNYFGIIKSINKLYSIVKKENITIIHSHKRLTDLISRIIARKANIAHISTCHSMFASKYFISVFGDITIAPNLKILSMLQSDFNIRSEKIRQIPLGRKPLREYSIEEKIRVREALNIDMNKKIIASVGRLVEEKDRITLLHSISLLENQNELTNELFVILGDGELKDRLIKVAKKLKIDQRVRFLDSGYKVEDLFNIADFCVISSQREGGILYVNLEAASLGKPHIATNVGGIPEFIINNETGILVQPRNPSELANAILYLLEHPEEVKRMGMNAKERFEKYHNYDNFISETIRVYEDVLKKN